MAWKHSASLQYRQRRVGRSDLFLRRHVWTGNAALSLIWVSERAACKFVSVPIDGSIRTSGRRGKMRALLAFTRLLWKFPMTRTSRSVAVAHDHNRAALSKGQKAFNSAIRQIEKRRKRLRAWESVTPVFQQQYVNELLPLEQKSSALQIRMVHCLDRAYDRLTKAERRKVALVIVDLAGEKVSKPSTTNTAPRATTARWPLRSVK